MTLNQDTALLGLSPNATAQEIKSAYRERAMTAHPDKLGNAEVFAELSAAYKRLRDAATRREAVCPECNGKGTIPLYSGYYTTRQACPRCKLVSKP